MRNEEEECPKHLRATLANFRSYCKTNNKSEIRLSYENNGNSSITKYRSLREMKGKGNKKFIQNGKDDNKERLPSPTKHSCSFDFKNLELVQMIKFKLKNEKVEPQRLQT